ncbi:MAG: CotH kinase family protein [Bacteroides sp.]|nr:CotH kinase family protein [Bacteroides sp.]MCM1413948.1 CotH kinase family protein [Bacteroides sp.]MCM1471625.1 CotH kinase family protein [Bacteroides sp.]
MQQPNGVTARFTHNTPEELSTLQREWLVDQFEKMTEAIYCSDKTSREWEEYIDIHSLAKYYVIQEFTGNWDAFIGSSYLHKDLGKKWTFGPIWDSGWTFCYDRRKGTFFEERYDAYGKSGINYIWIEELLKFPHFREVVAEQWHEFEPKIDVLSEYMDSLHAVVGPAIKLSYDSIWTQYNPGWHDANRVKEVIKKFLPVSREWFNSYIDDTLLDIDEIEADKRKLELTIADGSIVVSTAGELKTLRVYDIFGRQCQTRQRADNSWSVLSGPGLYVVQVTLSDGTRVAKTVRL